MGKKYVPKLWDVQFCKGIKRVIHFEAKMEVLNYLQ